jgi:POT family proton-dependent oligopeptide transporter
VPDKNRATSGAIAQPTLFGHPTGLTVLFSTEAMAYFSAFGMQALLVLYMVRQLDFTQPQASFIYGLYVGAANLTPLLGGFIADRYIGKGRAITLGASLMALGHLAMTWNSGLYAGLALVALGNGFFITSLASQIGDLYAASDPRRERAYVIYYLGINLGSFVAPIVCGTLADAYGWHYGFAAAAIAMTLGLIIHIMFKPVLSASLAYSRQFNASPASPDVPKSPAAGLATKLPLLAAVLGLVILFRLGYEQIGNTIALWIDGNTDRILGGFRIPAPWFQSLNPLLIFTLTPLLTWYWRRREDAGRSIPTLSKMMLGCAFSALAYLAMIGGAWEWGMHGQASMVWPLLFFLFMTLAEIHVLPIGLALFGRLSPAAHASFIIGIWYSAKFVASIAAGAFGTLWTTLTPTAFFAVNIGLALLTMLLMYGAGRIGLNRALAR